jgi:hypothetical protein
MKYAKYALLLAAVAILWPAGPAHSENVTAEEARQIATNWTSRILHRMGSWGEQATAEIASVEEFRSDERLLGYYCTVRPAGFIIVSLVKGLAPVKVYSYTSRLDLEADDGPTAMLEFQMERLIRELELQIGPVADLTPEEVEQALVYKHVETLNRLNVRPDRFLLETSTSTPQQDYIEEGILLSSEWHQSNPYFLQVPDAHNGCTETNCAVGCVATAAAQIMRYWSWPPGREWGRMPDYVDATSPTPCINAVAALCAAIGSAVGMDYCSKECASSVPTADMAPVYDAWHYADCEVVLRDDYSQETWWQMAKAHLDVNEPIQYRIMGHSIVLDGWQEWVTGAYQPEYHMNYGWEDVSFNAWYPIDGLHQIIDGASWEDEYMIVGIVPGMSLHSTVSGPQVKWPFNYRYVNRDCTAAAADFDPGQFIQFLPGVTLVCTRGILRFAGLPDNNTYLYTPEPERGIRIQNGAMVFQPGGGIRFQQSRPGPGS